MPSVHAYLAIYILVQQYIFQSGNTYFRAAMHISEQQYIFQRSRYAHGEDTVSTRWERQARTVWGRRVRYQAGRTQYTDPVYRPGIQTRYRFGRWDFTACHLNQTEWASAINHHWEGRHPLPPHERTGNGRVTGSPSLYRPHTVLLLSAAGHPRKAKVLHAQNSCRAWIDGGVSWMCSMVGKRLTVFRRLHQLFHTVANGEPTRQSVTAALSTASKLTVCWLGGGGGLIQFKDL